MQKLANNQFWYPDIGAYVRAAVDAPCVNPENEETRKTWNTANLGADWMGIRGKGRVIDIVPIARGGWADGAKRIKDNLAALLKAAPQQAKSARRKRVWGEMGEEICLDKLRMGNLECWRGIRKSDVKAPPVIRVFVDNIAPGGADAETMFWRGAAAVALSDKLISAGYCVELVSGFTGSLQGPVSVASVIKPARAPYSLTHAAAGLACPGYFRALGHSHNFAVNPNAIGSPGYSVREVDAQFARAFLPDNGVLILAGHREAEDLESAQAWIVKQLEMLAGGPQRLAA